MSDEALAWRCQPCFCSLLSQEESRRKRTTQKGHGGDLGNLQAFLAQAALVVGHSSACCRSPGGKIMDAAGLFPSQTSPGTVPSTIAATGVARTSLESNWDSPPDSRNATLNSTSKNTLAAVKRYLKHAQSTSKCFLDENLPHFGASFRYYDDGFHNLSFTSQNKNSLSRLLHNYINLQNSRFFMLPCTITDNIQVTKTMFQTPQWLVFQVNHK